MDEVYKRLAERLDELPNGYPATESGVELKIPKSERVRSTHFAGLFFS